MTACEHLIKSNWMESTEQQPLNSINKELRTYNFSNQYQIEIMQQIKNRLK